MTVPGLTFDLPPERSDPHLYFVISVPTLFAQVAIANFTTRRDPCDTACIVRRGEHPFVQRETIVAYDRSRLVDVDEFQKRVDAGIYRLRTDSLSQELLLRIQNGALASAHTAGKVQDAVRWTLEGGDEA